MFNENESLLLENIEDVCRTCLNKNVSLNLFGSFYKDKVYSDLLTMFSLLKVQSTDNLPKNICTICADLLIKIHSFKDKIEQSQIILNRCLTEIKNIGPQSADDFDESFNSNVDSDVSDCKNQQIEEGSTKNFTCSFCSLKFFSYTAYIAHRKSEADLRRKKQACSVCNKLISTYKLKDHMNSHTKERPYECEICGEKFRFRSSLSRHNFRHKDKKPHVCHICGRGFIQAPTLTDHIRTHLGQKSCICCVCGKSFITKHALGNHMTLHKIGNNEIDLSSNSICKECNKTFTSPQALKQHMHTHCDKKFLCSNCGKKFSTKTLLDSHFKIHTGVKPYICPICEKAFSQKNSLAKHSRMHTGEKPIVCIICNKRFSQQSHLTYHMRQHSGERPYNCKFCDKTFNHSGSLKIHTRLHTGEKPYTCNICSKGFYDSSSMKKHKKGHDENRTQLAVLVTVG
ncbi:zinc finger protein OZF-like [Diorhabda carinulata]|uniref:zinc finger protein OZF-like n=1 Tax=Diorhabda carinulata TaxID=1163345 RepID=UPI0025A05FBF|nr:zinc finger protein OZF-like [Diorhabda carinulata]